ncbi:iron-sulfur cluster repair di-iron protein [Bacillus sp. T3]|uniref:iron-sulfur cluster repair di-iron protein n=1 Tax=Bacillus sp. T3 TaxID=467262 RepID=UPI002981D1D7|nr:iron-sulfur cluster repair di-iron protein [Bacillus sp. T3]
MTTMPYTETSLVKDIVNEIPKSADLFKRYRIDFCCGGNRPLKDSAAEYNVNMETLMAELADVYAKSIGEPIDMEVWTNTDSNTLVEHVIEKYHRPLEEELTMLSPYVTKVAKVHGDSHPELLRVYELFYELKKELLEHTAKEEATVFPMLLKLDEVEGAEREAMINEIKELEKEHDHAGAILRELRKITSDYIPPAEACGTYRLVFKRLEMLESETFMHVHLENNILFPRFY